MVFSSVIFIFIFLPVTLFFYFIAEKSGKMLFKNAVVLISSLIFYAWGGVQYLILLLGLIAVNYAMGMLIQKYPERKKTFLLTGIIADIGSLVIFKYLNFIVSNTESFIQTVTNAGFSFNIPEIVLPIGISFFTFQIMSYLIDVYRGTVPAQKNISKLALYIMMFPQLIAGPIVRYKDVNEQIESRKTTLKMTEAGLKRFIIGFCKKVFIANSMGAAADSVFNLSGDVGSPYAWLGILCYAMQIFFDFSAYSDMAIGLGKIFGFHFLENFNYPYISASIKEFWRRWHISLSTWFRDYVYIPLGGNRKGSARTYLNLFIVFLLTGIWHGAAWQFIVWGLFHGAFMLLERTRFGNWQQKWPSFFRHAYTLIIVFTGWVFFRAASLPDAMNYLKNMFSFNFNIPADPEVIAAFTNLSWVMLITAVLASAPLFKKLSALQFRFKDNISRIGHIMLFTAAIVYLSGLSYNPFIYFQF